VSGSDEQASDLLLKTVGSEGQGVVGAGADAEVSAKSNRDAVIVEGDDFSVVASKGDIEEHGSCRIECCAGVVVEDTVICGDGGCIGDGDGLDITDGTIIRWCVERSGGCVRGAELS